MIFFIDDKKYNYSKDELSDKLISDEGTEGNVYKIENRAVKIYKPRKVKYRLDKNTTDLLKKISTTRVLLPKESVFNEKNVFSGYTTKYIDSKLNKTRLSKLIKMKKLYEEIKLYEEDVNRLTSENISIADLNINNIEVSDGIYFCDPGSFLVEKENNRFLGSLNREEVKLFFLNDILSNGLTDKESRKLKNHFLFGTHLSEMLECENIDADETVHNFVKKIVNKR